MTLAIYRTSGHLTGTIEAENVAAAQKYLTHDHEGNAQDMEQYLDEPLKGVVVSLRWQLDGNGHDYSVEAICERELTPDELTQLSSEVSGQNSDGLGESFEQQAFAWDEDSDGCGDCDGCTNWDACDEDGDGRMISFDWQSNELPWVRVK